MSIGSVGEFHYLQSGKLLRSRCHTWCQKQLNLAYFSQQTLSPFISHQLCFLFFSRILNKYSSNVETSGPFRFTFSPPQSGREGRRRWRVIFGRQQEILYKTPPLCSYTHWYTPLTLQYFKIIRIILRISVMFSCSLQIKTGTWSLGSFSVTFINNLNAS